MPPAGKSFAEFFPAAPRVAKNKVKTGEHERAKSRTSEPSDIVLTAAYQASATTSKPRDDKQQLSGSMASAQAGEIITDNESFQGDTLNGVGSASSHTSAGSSLFSAVGQNQTSTFGGTGSMSNLTPLTNVDTSPPEQPITPPQLKSTTSNSQSHLEDSVMGDDGSGLSYTRDDNTLVPPRVLMRDASQRVLGFICTRDPLLDDSIPKDKAKKTKPTYKEFGMVRTYNCGERHLAFGE